jgi:hypothetical protein
VKGAAKERSERRIVDSDKSPSKRTAKTFLAMPTSAICNVTYSGHD